jgi:phosphate acetyltransferase
MQNITFDELQIGQSAGLKRTLTQRDIELFAAASGDVNPSHFDADFAKSLPYQRVIGHGMWSGTLISTILGTILPGPGTIYREQALIFEHPVFIGDEVTVRLTVRSKDAATHTATFDCLCKNSRGEIIAEGIATVIAPTERSTAARPELSDVQIYDTDHYKEILAGCRKFGKIKTAVVYPTKANAISAVAEAAAEGLIEPVLIGPAETIRAAATECGVDISPWTLIDVEFSTASAAKAVELAAKGEVDAIMKGSLHSDELLGAVVSSTGGLRTSRRTSHAFVLDVSTYDKPIIITDAALNIAPKLEDKVDICQNTIDLWHILFGNERKPKVAILSAVETVTSRMPSTLEAACLCKMADRGQITGALLDGPLAFDNAISAQAAKDKGITSEVAGDADILLVPNIEAGNALVKQLTFLGHAEAAGIVLGARVPVILTSRADSLRARLFSCAVAVYLANAKKKGA